MFKKLAIKKPTENSSKRIIKINRQETQATVDYEINGEQHKITVVH
jgi:ribosomal protein S5